MNHYSTKPAPITDIRTVKKRLIRNGLTGFTWYGNRIILHHPTKIDIDIEFRNGVLTLNPVSPHVELLHFHYGPGGRDGILVIIIRWCIYYFRKWYYKDEINAFQKNLEASLYVNEKIILPSNFTGISKNLEDIKDRLLAAGFGFTSYRKKVIVHRKKEHVVIKDNKEGISLKSAISTEKYVLFFFLTFVAFIYLFFFKEAIDLEVILILSAICAYAGFIFIARNRTTDMKRDIERVLGNGMTKKQQNC